MSEPTKESIYTTRPLSPDTWGDFTGLVEANIGVWGGCWCIGFHPEGVVRDRTRNRDAKRVHVADGTVHQVLVYAGEECVGWCQYGPPDELPSIKNLKVYAPERTECDLPAVGKAAHEVVQQAKDAGVWISGGGVESQMASVVATDGTVTDGPYPEAKAVLGGFSIVDVPSREEALRWAAKIARACRCAQEVRELMPDPDV